MGCCTNRIKAQFADRRTFRDGERGCKENEPKYQARLLE